MPRARRLRRRAAQLTADGLLIRRADHPGRAAPWHRSATRRYPLQRMGLRARIPRRTGRSDAATGFTPGPAPRRRLQRSLRECASSRHGAYIRSPMRPTLHARRARHARAWRIADAGALKSLLGHRHKARWAVAGVEAQRPLFEAAVPEASIALPLPSVEQDVRTDYETLGLTLGPHPLSLLRPVLAECDATCGRAISRRCRTVGMPSSPVSSPCVSDPIPRAA